MRTRSLQTARNALRPGTLPLVVTMLMSFIISFSVMWWQRKQAPRAPQGPTAPGTSILHSIPGPASLQAERPAGVRSALGPGTVTVGTQATENASDSEVKPELPVMFNIVKTTAYVDDENRAGAKIAKDVYEAIVSNGAEKTLDFTVVETNLPTMEKSESEFTLAPGNQRHFGVGQRLKMLSGDELTLRSHGYREITKSIP